MCFAFVTAPHHPFGVPGVGRTPSPSRANGLTFAPFVRKLRGNTVSDSTPTPGSAGDLKARGAAQVAALARAKLNPAAVSPTRKKIALAIAGVADLIQMGGFAFFGEGILSIPDDILDGIVALLLVIVLGFRWRLLMSLALELVPFATLFPSWTAVVLSIEASSAASAATGAQTVPVEKPPEQLKS
jgi:hypothetical protein